MLTIRIETKGTRKFSWTSSASRGFYENTAPSLHEAFIEAIADFHVFLLEEGSQDGIEACLVTWKDDDDLYAFIFPKGSEISAKLPWVLMHTKPENVLRSSETRRG